MDKADEERTLRIHQAVARRIGIAIVAGRLLPGALLGGEIEQAEATGVSRTAYREAIRILVAKGLIRTQPKVGTHVTPRARWNLLDPDVLAWMFSSEPSASFTRDLFELRGLIEPAAAAFAAQRRSAEQIDAMHIALDEMARETLATGAGQAADKRFHRIILEASANEALAALASTVGAAVTWTTRVKQRRTTSPRDPIGEHRAVLDAIVEQDAPRARRAMEHLLAMALADMPEIGRSDA